jgi:aminomethyltransferase
LNQLPIDIPLKNFHKNNGAKMIPFAGFNMPINYKSGIIIEHKNVRNHSGIFDVSHMGQVLIEANNLHINNLEKYIPLKLNNLRKNKSNYTFLLNENGGVVDDLIVSLIDINSKFFLYIVYNASRKIEDEKIFLKCAPKAEIIHSKNCLFAIQGPKSIEVLNNIIEVPVDMNFLDIRVLKYKKNSVIISRSGYTGEDGFEISISNEQAEEFVRDLLENKNTMLCGLGARDSLRLEAGLSLYGHELNENITPIEAGLSWALDKDRLNDSSLNGYKVLLDQLHNKPSNKKIGLISINRSMLRDGMILFDSNKNDIGKITSGCFSPNLNKSIAIGYVNSHFEEEKEIFCEIRNKMELVKKTNLPFVKKNYKKNGSNNE